MKKTIAITLASALLAAALTGSGTGIEATANGTCDIGLAYITGRFG